MKITKIILQNFRAFDECFELDLEGGKNLLLNGENGSGKSSIYLALKRLFEERGDDITAHRNHFAPPIRTPEVRVHLKGKDAAGGDFDKEICWDATVGHPLPVPVPPAIGPLADADRSLLVDGAHRAGFLDYRAMLRTHLLSNPLPRTNTGPAVHNIIYGAELSGLEAQFFDLVSLVVLAGVRVTAAGGAETTIGTLMRRVWEHRPFARYNLELNRANAYANAFNEAFNAKLPELEAKLAEFLGYFENHQLAIKFNPVSLAWDKATLELQGAEMMPDIEFRGMTVTDHHEFLNEARLSAIAICMFLAGVHFCDNDYPNPDYPRFLVMDDALIGLDLQNRLPILRILASDTFKHYQILLLMFDKVWFDLARGHLPERDGWLHKELIADEDTGHLIPRLKPSMADLERARYHLNNGDLMAAGVYARAAFEWKLRNVCEDKGIQVNYKKDNKKIGMDDLWQGILARQRQRVNYQATHAGAPDFIPATLVNDVETMRTTVLNQLSHAGAPGLVRDDVRDALRTVEAVHNHPFPNV